jgi:kynurenine formamidase
LKKLGVHNIPPLAGRAVIIDMAKHAGKKTLAAGYHFGSAEIKAAAAAQGVAYGKGDIVLFHTGWTQTMLKSDPKAWVSGEPGLNNDGARYLAGVNLMAVGADTWGVEPVPAPKGDGVFYRHVLLLQEQGVYLLETMNTGPVLRAGVNEFMFILGPARIRGSVQMIINPVALF